MPNQRISARAMLVGCNLPREGLALGVGIARGWIPVHFVALQFIRLVLGRALMVLQAARASFYYFQNAESSTQLNDVRARLLGVKNASLLFHPVRDPLRLRGEIAQVVGLKVMDAGYVLRHVSAQ